MVHVNVNGWMKITERKTVAEWMVGDAILHVVDLTFVGDIEGKRRRTLPTWKFHDKSDDTVQFKALPPAMALVDLNQKGANQRRPKKQPASGRTQP